MREKGGEHRGTRVLVMGLDGATFDLMDPMMERGELPNLSQLVKSGTRDELASTIHPYSAPAWTSFMTGKNPGKHGIFDFAQRQLNTYEPHFITSWDRKAKSLWRILSEGGKRVGVINVPITYPPEEVNGFLIAGLGTPGTDSPYTYPPGLKKEIQSRVGHYEVTIPIRDYIRGKRLDVFLERLHRTMDQRFKLARNLFGENSLDFSMVVFGATDKVQHFFWKYMDQEHPLYSNGEAQFREAICDVYRKADTYIGELIGDVDQNTTVMILSDHGHGGNSNKALFLNKWLETLGLLRFKKEGEIGSRIRFGFMRQLILLGKRYLPRHVKERMRRVSGVRSKVESFMRSYLIDWSQTKAYADEFRGNVYINLKGREPEGVVEPGEECEALRDFIVEKLYELRDPQTGERIVETVFKREQLYTGKHTVFAPDILFIQNPRRYSYTYRRSHTSRDDSFIKTFSPDELKDDLRPNADHRRNGILIMSGKGVRKDYRMHGSEIIDVAPSILYLMGLPIPEDMDGKILTDAIEDSFIARHPVCYTEASQEGPVSERGPAYSSAEEEKVKETLRGLGYID